MNSKNNDTPQQSATTVFIFLLVVSALFPVLLWWYAPEGTTQQDRQRAEEDQQLVALAERVAKIVLRTIFASALNSLGVVVTMKDEEGRNHGFHRIPMNKPDLPLQTKLLTKTSLR
jgi:hypothetical protein